MACSRLFSKDQPHRKLCPRCRNDRWLLRHADELEEYLAAGSTLKFAIREIYYQNRPICVSCGRPIKGGTDRAAFCTRTIECRRWRRRYRTLREANTRKGIIDPAKKALAQVAAEVFAEKGEIMLIN